jgi:hypothetical protein
VVARNRISEYKGKRAEAQLRAGLSTVIEADIPQRLDRDDPPPDEGWSGQYL